jgi:hypothetical protein
MWLRASPFASSAAHTLPGLRVLCWYRNIEPLAAVVAVAVAARWRYHRPCWRYLVPWIVRLGPLAVCRTVAHQAICAGHTGRDDTSCHPNSIRLCRYRLLLPRVVHLQPFRPLTGVRSTLPHASVLRLPSANRNQRYWQHWRCRRR